jgi:mxaK protein
MNDGRLLALWRASRSPLLAALTSALAAATLAAALSWRDALEANGAIAALRDGHDIAPDLASRPELLLARIAFLTARGELDRARALLEALDRREEAGLRARGHYLLGNALMREAFAHIEGSEFDAADPFVTLAKREYRIALRLTPDDWDAKYNLDVAARLRRDFPDDARKGDDELVADPKKLWTDIPGKPKGLP